MDRRYHITGDNFLCSMYNVLFEFFLSIFSSMISCVVCEK